MERRICVGVAGASGHTGGEVCRLLLGHENVAKILPSSRGEIAFEQLHPNLLGCGLEFITPETLASHAHELDAVFFCTPSGESMRAAEHFLRAGVKVVDLSPDFRFPTPALYESAYGKAHTAPHLLAEAVYGVTELARDAVRRASLVANPGCYAITTILGVAPALVHNLVATDATVHVSAVNGTTGAGSEPMRETSHAAVGGGMLPYSLEGHRHVPELEHHLGAIASRRLEVVLTTAHGNFARGILATITLRARADIADSLSRDTLTRIWNNHYGNGAAGENFVVVNSFSRSGGKHKKEYHLYPNVARLAGANHCHIGLDYDHTCGRIKIVAAIDNLVKGAAGSAIQNMNLMLGLPEDIGLKAYGL